MYAEFSDSLPANCADSVVLEICNTGHRIGKSPSVLHHMVMNGVLVKMRKSVEIHGDRS